VTTSRIRGSAEAIDSRFVRSFNACVDDWEAWSGVRAVVLSPYGGGRTAAEQQRINPGQKFSDHLLSSANIGRAAADVDNWRQIILAGAKRHGLSYEQAKAKYYAIAAKHGWKNQQINGAPFPLEGWHLAKHYPDPPLPKAAPKMEDGMLYLLYNTKANQAIYRPGRPLRRITDAQAAPAARLLKQLNLVSDKATLDQVRTKVDAEAWAQLVALEGIE